MLDRRAANVPQAAGTDRRAERVQLHAENGERAEERSDSRPNEDRSRRHTNNGVRETRLHVTREQLRAAREQNFTNEFKRVPADILIHDNSPNVVSVVRRHLTPISVYTECDDFPSLAIVYVSSRPFR